MTTLIEVSEVSISLGILNRRLDDPMPLYREWGIYLEGLIQTAFDRETSPAGVRWQPLSDPYALYKSRKFPGAKILQRRKDDGLRASIRSNPSPDGLTVGTDLMAGKWSLGAIHQYGAPRANIPARPFLPLDSDGELLPQVESELTRMAINYLVRP